MTRRLLWVTGTVPAVLVAAWLIAGLPLLLAGALRPQWTVPAAVAVAAPLVLLVSRAAAPPPRSALPLALAVGIAAGFAALAWTTSSEHVVVRRDPGVYAQTADWLAAHGRLPIPAHAAAFGHTPGLGFGSPGFYEHGAAPALVPQFMSGTSLALTPAGWTAGLRGITKADAVIGALALLAVAGLAARLAGAWAAPIAALALALTYPELHQARSAFSEPGAQLLLFGGLSVWADARRAIRERGMTALHAVAGCLIGLGVLFRIDALTELLPLIPVLFWLYVSGASDRRVVSAVAGGLTFGVGLGLLDGFVVTRPYVTSVAHQLRLVAVAAIALVAASALGVWLWPRLRDRWPVARRALPELVAAVIVVTAALAWFVRPHVMHPQFSAANAGGREVVALQRFLGLPADGPRTYAEHSMQWLAWWLGPSGLALAVVALGMLVRRALRAGKSPGNGRGNGPMLAFLAILIGTAAFTLAQPSITPDHPWADRRFVPVVFPGLVAAASWFIVSAGRWVRARWGRVAAGSLVTAALSAMVVPALAASWPLLGQSTERGELAAVHRVCRALPPRAAVFVTGVRAGLEWPQVIRGDCRVPVAVVAGGDRAAVVHVAAAAARVQGRQPVLIADTVNDVTDAGAANARLIVVVVVREADHQLVQRPRDTRRVPIDIWMGRPV